MKETAQNHNEGPETQAALLAAFRSILGNTNDVIFLKDTNLRYLAVSDACVKMLGKSSAAEILGKTAEEVLGSAEAAAGYRQLEERVFFTGVDEVNVVAPIPGKRGQFRYGSASRYLLTDSRGDPVGILSILRDVTREYLARQHYQQALKLLLKLPEDIYAAVLIDVDQWRLIGKRSQLIRGCTLPALRTIDDLYGFLMGDQVASEGESILTEQDFSQAGLKGIYLRGQSLLEFSSCRRLPGYVVRWVRSKVQFLIEDKSGHLCVLLSVQDIDAKKQAEQALLTAAQMDQMTQVLNRETTMRRIREILASRTTQTHAFFILDVDNFKKLNDTRGHQAGDDYLIALAQSLKRSFREEDVVGRIGGDEFFVLMRNIGTPQMATRRARELLEEVRVLGERYPEVPLSVSIGIALYPEHGRTVEELYEKADASLYRVKKSGKNRFALAALSREAAAPENTEGDSAMTVKEFYNAQGGDYQDVIDRLHSEEIVLKFLVRLLDDPCFEKLKEAMAARDAKKAFSVVHTFKGTCINMGLGHLANAAKALTEAVRHEFSPEAPALFQTVAEAYESAMAGIRALRDASQA